ncbi:hemoblobin-interacting domain-containing protein [Paenibacillus flagellatus]|uniref:hemoblobin-interacting domain-containing protein n=1 Tax=Paenibacillus flagellatus TaxID=2211139 RepID=UPI0013053A97|nr:hemoblobin-interacting domain-containing protein [Paenibacillus flagellatus]
MQHSNTNADFNGVAFGNGTYVAVGSAGTILTSGDGIHWTPRPSNTENSLNGVAYGSGVFTAVGMNGTILTSADGVSWVNRSSGSADFYSSVIYAKGLFLIAGFMPTLVSSDAGNTWTASNGNFFSSIAYGNGMFVATGFMGFATSGDGVHWESLGWSPNDPVNVIVYGNGTFVAAGGNGSVLTSSDGANWTGRTSGTAASLFGAAYYNGTFLAVGQSGTIIRAAGHILNYDGNGAAGGSAPTDSGSYADGAAVTVLGNQGNLTKPGLVFAGWNTEPDGSGTRYAEGDAYPIGSADATLYAEWVSGNSYLAGLSVDRGRLSPAFAPSTMNYVVHVGYAVTSLELSLATSEPTQTVTVTGAVYDSSTGSYRASGLQPGPNPIRIEVVAQSGASVAYEVVIDRAAVLSANADLSGLSLSVGAIPDFAPDQTEYVVDVGNEVSGLVVSATASDVNAAVSVNGQPEAVGEASGEVALNVGDNAVRIEVTAQDGTKKTYTITVRRAASGNADLSGLTLSSGFLNPGFRPEISDYTAIVANDVSGLAVTATSAEPSAELTVNGIPVRSGQDSEIIPLHVGYNTIAVNVTAPDRTVRSYRVTVFRDAMPMLGESWQAMGDTSDFPADPTAGEPFLFVDRGTPYVAYPSQEDDDRIVVRTFDGLNWVTLGETAMPGLTGNPSLHVDRGTTYLAYTASDQSLTVSQYDGTGWMPIGDVLWGSSPSLAMDNGILYIAYLDLENKLTVKQYEHASWTPVGGAVSSGRASRPSLNVQDGTFYLAYSDVDNGEKVAVKTLDGTDWVPVGTGAFPDGSGHSFTLDADHGRPYVAFSDPASPNHAVVMTHEGDKWTQVGAELSTSSVAMSVVDGIPYVALSDPSRSGSATLFKYDAFEWTQVGEAGFTEPSAQKMTLVFYKGTPYLAYRDGAGKLGVESFVAPPPSLDADISDHDPEHPIELTFEDDANWRESIVSVLDGSTRLVEGTDYTIGSGSITFAPGKLGAGEHVLTISASGYANAVVGQTVLAFPPVLAADDTDNDVANPIAISFPPDAAWRSAILSVQVGGVALPFTGYFLFEDDRILFYAGTLAAGEHIVAVSAAGYRDAVVTQFVYKAAPILSADATDNDTAHPITITFGDNADWRDAIAEVKADSVALEEGTDYTIGDGTITIRAGRLAAGDHVIAIAAPGYFTREVSQFVYGVPPAWKANETYDVARPIALAFADDAAWRDAITAIRVRRALGVEETSLVEGVDYTIGAGAITIFAGKIPSGEHVVTVTASGYYDAEASLLVLDFPPVLTADTTDNDIDHPIVVTFPDDLRWRGRMASVKAGATVLEEGTDYLVEAGTITFYKGKLPAGELVITVTSWGYYDARLDQIVYAFPPALTADATDNDAAHPITLTFADDAAWRDAITAVRAGAKTLAEGTDYTIGEGAITFGAGALPAGEHAIAVSAAGYYDAEASQFVYAIPPALTADTTDNDAAHPITLSFADDAAWREAIAAVRAGTKTLEEGTDYTIGEGAITVEAGTLPAGESVLTVEAEGYRDAVAGQFVYAVPPTLTPDVTDNDAAHPITLSFADDAAWRDAIAAVQAGAKTLAEGTDYAIGEGAITFGAGTLPAGESVVTVKADGYRDAVASQFVYAIPPLLAADATDNDAAHPITLTFADDAAWRNAITAVRAGAKTLAEGTDYTIGEGAITFGAGALPAGEHAIAVSAAGYYDAEASQFVYAIPPHLTADATDNDVAHPVTLSFADDPAWRDAIAAVRAGTKTLEEGTDYTIDEGAITFGAGTLPAGESVLTVEAEGYRDAVAGQFVYAIPPALTADVTDNDAAHPITLSFADDAAWRDAIAAVQAGAKTLAEGTDYAIGEGAITFGAGTLPAGESVVTVKADGYRDAVASQFVYAIPPLLAADATDNNFAHPITLTFADDAAWRDAITVVKIDSTIFAEGTDYTIREGSLTIAARRLTPGTHTVAVVANGFLDATTVQPIGQSNISNLTGLIVSTGALNETFDANTLDYTQRVAHDIESLTVTPTAEDADAVITVNGTPVAGGEASAPIALDDGENTVTLVVTAPDGSTKTYRIRVTRAPSGNAELGGLTLSTGTLNPGFAPGIFRYEANVANGVTGLTVTVTASDRGATITIDGRQAVSGVPSEPVGLDVGRNEIIIEVTAKDGSKNSYTIIVNRASGSGGVGGWGAVPPVPSGPTISRNGRLTLSAGQQGEVSLGDEIKVTIPAGASTKELTVSIDKVPNFGDPVTGEAVLASQVYEILKNFPVNFDKPVRLSIRFDPSGLKSSQRAVLSYFDEADERWVEIGGVADGTYIAAEVNHFTKFALLAVGPSDDKPTNPSPEFADVAGHWAEARIAQAAQAGIVSGYPDGSFKPNAAVTRAEFTVMLARAWKLQDEARSLPFSDSQQIGAWARASVAQAVASGIIEGFDDGSFRPDAEITRAEVAVMIAKALKLPIDPNVSTSFADDQAIPTWAKGALAALAKRGVMNGKGANEFDPAGKATRAEAVTVLLNMQE